MLEQIIYWGSVFHIVAPLAAIVLLVVFGFLVCVYGAFDFLWVRCRSLRDRFSAWRSRRM